MIDRSHNLWWASADEHPTAPSLQGDDHRSDIVVIGAGLMGTTATQALAAAGADVTLIEAGRIGSGASSTPGGFVVPHFSVGNPLDIIERTGDVGERLVHAAGGSAAHLFDKIRMLGLQCDARQDGWYQPAHSPGALANIENIVRQWRDLGFAVSLLDAAQTCRRTGVEGYRGSWFAPTGGTLHPLRYCRSIMDLATAQGARLHENSPVVAIERQGSQYVVRTGKGSISAQRILVCTNGLSSGITPRLASSIVPLGVWQCATAPIPAEQRRHLFQGGEALSDTRQDLFTYRFDIEGRLITGALDAFGISPELQTKRMAKRLQQQLRLSERPAIPYLWFGTSSISAPRYPATLVIDGGIVAASSCNARGIALSVVAGDSLARYLLTGEQPPMPLLDAKPHSHTWLQRRLSRFYPHMAPILDRIEEWRDAVRRK